MSTRALIRVLVAPALLASIAAPVAAQKGKVTIQGVVKAENGPPLELAEVLVFGTDIRTRTTETGTFRLPAINQGRYFVGVRRLGFEPLVFSMTLVGGQDREIEVELSQLPQNLTPVKIKARSDFNQMRYADLIRRRRTAWGRFLTRDDIERDRPYSIASLVARYIPGVSIQALESGADVFGVRGFPAGSGFGTGYSYNCVPALSIDGRPPIPGWPLSMYQPDEIEAIEIYRGRVTRMPVELANQYTGCGVIVLWTR